MLELKGSWVQIADCRATFALIGDSEVGQPSSAYNISSPPIPSPFSRSPQTSLSTLCSPHKPSPVLGVFIQFVIWAPSHDKAHSPISTVAIHQPLEWNDALSLIEYLDINSMW